MSLINQMLNDIDLRQKKEETEATLSELSAVSALRSKAPLAVVSATMLILIVASAWLWWQPAAPLQKVAVNLRTVPPATPPTRAIPLAATPATVSPVSRQPSLVEKAVPNSLVDVYTAGDTTEVRWVFESNQPLKHQIDSLPSGYLLTLVGPLELADQLEWPEAEGLTVAHVQQTDEVTKIKLLSTVPGEIDSFILPPSATHGHRLVLAFRSETPPPKPASTAGPIPTPAVSSANQPASPRVPPIEKPTTPPASNTPVAQTTAAVEPHTVTKAPPASDLPQVRLLIQQGRLADARRLLSAEASGEPSIDRMALEAALLHKEGRYMESVSGYRRLIQVSPEARWWVGLAVSAEGAGDIGLALQAYYQLQADPTVSAELQDFAKKRIHAVNGSAADSQRERL